MKKISYIRKGICKDFKNYILKKSKYTNIYNSPFSYPCTWVINLGYYKLKYFLTSNNFELIFHFFRELIWLGKLDYYDLHKPFRVNKNCKNLYITWLRKTDINKNYFFNSRQIPSFTNNNLWFLINVHNKINFKKKIKKQYFIYEKNIKHFSILGLFKIFICLLIEKKFKLRKVIYEINSDSFFSNLIYKNIKKIIKENEIENIYLPFEAQPFQKNLIKNLRKDFKKINIFGFLNALQPFPIHLCDTKFLPDLSYSVSRAQINQLVNIFNWKKNKLKLIKSRTFKKNKKKYRNSIYLPFYITNYSKILLNIEKLFEIMPNKYFNKFNIKPHPTGILDPNYKKFVSDLKLIVKNFNYKFDNKKMNNFTIIVGSTSVVHEALENNLTVFHIVDLPVFEALENYFWPTVKILEMKPNIYKYKLNKFKTLINY